LAGALALGRIVETLLFGIVATDPMTPAAVTLLLTAIALLACFVPAWSATRVDPIVALRYQWVGLCYSLRSASNASMCAAR
jgi:ABC-type antimicrobial peptide transport system permease subunit